MEGGSWHEDERIGTGKVKIEKQKTVKLTMRQKMSNMRRASSFLSNHGFAPGQSADELKKKAIQEKLEQQIQEKYERE